MGKALRITTLPWMAEGFRIAAECRPADELAGDFYVVSPRGAGRLMVVIGDACGRGRQGAALLPEILPHARLLSASNLPPERLLDELNRTAARTLPLDRFVTAAALELDADLGTVTIANAGHVPALVRTALGYVRMLGRLAGPPLGVVPEIAYRSDCAPLGPGDEVVLMTDGLLEAMESDLIEMRRLRSLLARTRASAAPLNRAILAALDRRLRGRRNDDVTLVTIEMVEPARGRAAGFERAS